MFLQEALREGEKDKKIKKEREDNILNQRAARLVTLSCKDTHHCPLYENLNWLPLSEKMRGDLLILIFWSRSPPTNAIRIKPGMASYLPSPVPYTILLLFPVISLYKALFEEWPADEK